MSIIVTLILGGITGWLASILVNKNEAMGAIWNIVVGVVGAFLANVALAPLVGVQAELDNFTIGGFIMSVAGASLLLVIFNLLTRGKPRE